MIEICVKLEPTVESRICKDVNYIRYCEEKIVQKEICVPYTTDMQDAWRRLMEVVKGLGIKV